MNKIAANLISYGLMLPFVVLIVGAEVILVIKLLRVLMALVGL